MAEQKCSGVMTSNPTCCVPSDSVQEVAQRMRDEDVGPIPIVDSQENRRLVGIVTDRDLALKVVAEGRDAKSTKVQDVMSSNIVTVGPDDDIRRAFDAMQQNQIRRIPVVENGKIVGIIAQADIATRLEAPKETAKVVENISRP